MHRIGPPAGGAGTAVTESGAAGVAGLESRPSSQFIGWVADMTEIHFMVEEAPEGGYFAKAVGQDIFTEADDLPGLHQQLRDAVRCHFDENQRPSIIRLHITREEALAA